MKFQGDYSDGDTDCKNLFVWKKIFISETISAHHMYMKYISCEKI